MNDDEKGYVIPTQVDTSGTVEKDDTLLGRERDNIINATNQVNSSIDTSMVNETNNKYKIKKTPLIVRFTAIVLSCVLIFFVCFYAIKYSKRFIEAGVETTTTTTSSPLERAKEYWNKDIVRRYIDDNNKVYLFLPQEYDSSVYTIEFSTDGIYTELGTYDEKEVVLSMDDAYEYQLSDKGLLLGDKELTISSGEFKYYTYKDDNTNAILLINASQGLLYGLYIINNSVYEGKYMEYEDKIVLTGDQGEYVFTKDNKSVIYNDVKLELHV